MGHYSSVDIDGFDDGPDAEPYVDVAHDNGIDGGVIRLIIGLDFDHAAHVRLSREQAIWLAKALLEAERLSHWADGEQLETQGGPMSVRVSIPGLFGSITREHPTGVRWHINHQRRLVIFDAGDEAVALYKDNRWLEVWLENSDSASSSEGTKSTNHQVAETPAQA